jgi:hypothetical protein
MDDAKESYMWNPKYGKAVFIIAKLYFLEEDYENALYNIKLAC